MRKSITAMTLLMLGSQVMAEQAFSPYAGRDFPTKVLWGDTHLHTDMSMDAGAYGNRLGHEQAYRFAKGEEVTSTGGLAARLSAPLDFLVIADHSDNMGFFPDLFKGTDYILSQEIGRDWHQRIRSGQGASVAWEIVTSFSQGVFPENMVYWPDSEAYRGAWAKSVAAAEKHNDPGRFTAFVGYEWTSLALGGNMHRVVIYRDGADKAGQMVPYTTTAPYGSLDPRELWKWLERYEAETGGDVLAIAHNGNLANGIMFPIDEQYTGRKLDQSYVRARYRWEPIYEVTQIKGDGESHPFLSPNDEFADYENWDEWNLDRSTAKTDDMLAGEYAREALKRGLQLEQRLGTNPYRFGMIGSTDSHTSLATAEENNFFGKHSSREPGVGRMDHDRLGWEMVASGLAAVWAQENTRAAIFDAMARRETYATTGPRMTVRFFGGWDFTDADATSGTRDKIGYGKGVPMGGDLTAAPGGASPGFLIYAGKDPFSGNLDRIQVIKGWLDDAGEVHEKVYDVAWSGDRQPDAKGKLPAVGNTVDAATATWTNSIGAPELSTVWTDPDFDPGRNAFYYVRVIEIPTPRWSTYDAVRFGLALPEETQPFTRERAYTSPIWYSP